MKQIDRIRKFSDAFGPSGFEDAVVAYAQEEVREICTCKRGPYAQSVYEFEGKQSRVV